MKKRLYIAASLIAFHLAVTSAAYAQYRHAQYSHAQHSHMHGKVEFPNSCSSTVQAKLLDGIAMLHSFFYSGAQQAFEQVAREDKSCTIATWGYASILMLNPLQGVGASPENARLAQAAIDKARSVGVMMRSLISTSPRTLTLPSPKGRGKDFSTSSRTLTLPSPKGRGKDGSRY